MERTDLIDDNALGALFDLERRARAATSPTELRFIVVNESRNVVSFNHGALLEPSSVGWRVTAVSDVPAVDRGTPWTQWLERVFRETVSSGDGAYLVDPEQLPDWERTNWSDLSPPFGMFVPLGVPEQAPVAWLWLARETEWGDTQRSLAEHLGEVYGHALVTLLPTASGTGYIKWLRSRTLWLICAAAVLAVLAIPVRLSALASAEIVAKDPVIVAAPMKGVVDEVLVEPNARVEKGQPLVRLQDLKARNRYEVAKESLQVARAKFRKARQEAFEQSESRSRLAVLRAEASLRETEVRFARQQLDKVVIHAERSGIAIYNDPDDWAGRPVRTGERILQLASPEMREIRIDLAVSDAIVLERGAPLNLFLDAKPLEPVSGEVVRAAYKPVTTERDNLVYRVTANLSERPPWLRIGLRGTARIMGAKVPLAYYLFRRPLTAVRQTLGI